MKRIDLMYGGVPYSIGDRELKDVLDEISDGLAHSPQWLSVNSGEGTERHALLLLSPGVDLVVIPIPDPLPPGEGSADPFASAHYESETSTI